MFSVVIIIEYSRHIYVFDLLHIYIYIYRQVVKVLDSKSRGPVFKAIGWLQGRLSLSSSRVPGITGNLMVKSKLPPRRGSSLSP